MANNPVERTHFRALAVLDFSSYATVGGSLDTGAADFCVGSERMKVQVAQPEDVESWLGLATEVEHLFGPLVNEPNFLSALMRNIKRGSAYCIREFDGPAGAPLWAGVLFSANPPLYKIGWMAVSRDHRRCGFGRTLLAYITSLVELPGEITVTTFGPNVTGGEAARAFYLDAGFVPAEMTDNTSEGGSRQVFRKTMI